MEKIISKLSGLSRRSWLIILLTVVFLMFYNVAEDIRDHEALSSVDPVFGRWLLFHISPFDTTLAHNVTLFGGLEVMKIGAVIFVLYLLFKRQWVSAGMLILSVYSGLFLNSLIKGFFMRARPNFLGTVNQISGYSFPSNHSMSSIIFYGMIAYLLTSMITNRNVRILIWAVMSVLILAIGLSRLVLGVHYLTDVLGGWLAGGIWLLICILGGDVLRELLEKLVQNVYQRLKIKFQ